MHNYQDFLTLYQFKKNERGKETHTRIGTKKGETPIIYPGKYAIPANKMTEFYQLYYNYIFKNKKIVKHDFLTEKQNSKAGPICIDFDFRYPFEIDGEIPKRQHNSDTIADIIQLYIEKLSELIVFKPNTSFNIFVFEKDHVNQVENKNGKGGETKDGIHIIFGIHLDRILQQILRNKVKNEFFQTVDNLTNLKADCSADKILDEGITKGHTNWQLYGSRKPHNEPYQLIKYIIAEFGDDANDHSDVIMSELDETEWPIGPELLELVSVRNMNNIKYEMKEEIGNSYKSMKEELNHKRKKKGVKKNELKVGEIINNATLKEAVKNDLNDWDKENQFGCKSRHLKEIHDYVMALSASFYTDRNKWKRVGWALRNTSKQLFNTYMLFSSQWDKFSYDDIPREWDEWKKMGWRKNQRQNTQLLTGRSIMYWLHEENFSKWNEIFKDSIDYWLQSAIRSPRTHYALAVLLKKKFGDYFVCTSVERNHWYEFRHHRWRKTDSGHSLRCKISTDINKLCTDKCTVYSSKREEASKPEALDEKQADKYSDLMSKSATLADSLKTTSFKTNIMTESKHEFYVEKIEFVDKLDTNRYLLGFENGVFDFEKKKFRAGQPDDFISMSTKIKYYALDPTDEEQQHIIKEINTFMEQLFPIAELRKYMWEHLASTLTGINPNQTFNIYIGEGSNGKSKLIELMGLILGDYKTIIPLALITSKRPQIGSASPEVAILRGVRYAVMQEPSKGMTLNEGALKQYTGGDMMSGRMLFHDQIYFQPQFKLVVATNNLFGIKSDDEGTWRRIRVCDYISKFVNEPDENKPHQFKINMNLADNIEKWKHVFMAMLIQKNLETGGLVSDCPSVLTATTDYRSTQNYLAKFVHEMIDEEKDSYLRKKDVWDAFKFWYRENYDGKPAGKREELCNYLNRNLGMMISDKKDKNYNKWKGYIIIDDDDEGNAMGI